MRQPSPARNQTHQSDPTAQSWTQQAWGIEAMGQSGAAVGSDERSNDAWLSGVPDMGRASGYQAGGTWIPVGVCESWA
jgi:hypothetical protein